ncbi:unnamed protein product [Lactuca saligna]|uniref:Uncharacterized protein n=1 Tax=Lactuca saligna TaxID=75948 RepID=A0AA35YM88_LACSI|nr:unnamed protein product [Lactuca saligna]
MKSYLIGDISPKSIVLNGVVPDRDVDPMISILEFPVTLSSSSSSVGVVPPNILSPNQKCRWLLFPDHFEQLFLEIYQVGPRYTCPFTLGHVTLKPADAEVSLWVAEGMKLASEERLVKVAKMYADLSICHREGMAKVALLENQKALAQTNYEL